MILREQIKQVKEILKGLLNRIPTGEKRRAAAEIAKEFGVGGQSFVARELNMSKNTVRKGMQEIESGVNINDRFNERGRKKATEELPELKNQMRKILDSQSQADPKFQTERLYTNMSASEVRKQLIKQYGYSDEDLPTVRTLNTIINEMNYTLRSVKKTKPIKKVEETELIFYNMERVHEQAADDDEIVRISIDAKDKVKVGEFSRGGKSRVEVEAYDHDFGDKYLIPFGIMNVKEKTVYISLSATKVTSDYMVDRIEEYWIENGYSGTGKTLLINSDNGPENSSHRTQFMKRMIQFSIDHNTPVILAYYPPYHSKYNPVERVWGVLEQHWNGGLLDTTEAVMGYIKTMTYSNRRPEVKLIDKVYETGVKVGKEAMKIYESVLERMAGLEKWYVRISPQKSMDKLAFTDCFY